MEYLTKNGVKFGECGISHTVARHRRSYYMAETERNLALLSNFHEKVRLDK